MFQFLRRCYLPSKFPTIYFVFLTISLTFYASGCSSLISRKKQYSTINFDPTFIAQEEALSELNKKSNSANRTMDSESDPLSEKYFMQQWNKHRSESYTKALIAGIRDFKKSKKESIELGFKKVEKVRESENKGSKNGNGSKKLFVCYYSIPSVQDMPYPLFPESIDPHLCTHIIVAFARVKNNAIIPRYPRHIEFYNRTVGLKSHNPELKVMLSVGSSNINEAAENEFEKMMNSSETRLNFIKQSLMFIKAYNFDGLDIDWEFPGMRQKNQFALLFQEYRAVMAETGDSAILSAAVPSLKLKVDLGYDIKSLSETLDFVNLMTYDFHMYSWYSPVVGPNAPLFNTSFEFGFLATLNTAWSATYWYQNGFPAHKIAVGIPTYALTYTLVDKKYHDFYSLAAGFGKVGSSGYATFVDTCKFMERNGTQLVFDNEAKVSYTYAGKEWISFENEQSAKLKANWIRKSLFGGIMIWSINNDDAYKQCNTSTTTFPIMRAAKSEFFSTEPYGYWQTEYDKSSSAVTKKI